MSKVDSEKGGKLAYKVKTQNVCLGIGKKAVPVKARSLERFPHTETGLNKGAFFWVYECEGHPDLNEKRTIAIFLAT